MQMVVGQMVAQPARLLNARFFMSTTGHNGNLINPITAPPLAFIGDREFGSAPACDTGVCHEPLDPCSIQMPI
jgi:hypothetical protein